MQAILCKSQIAPGHSSLPRAGLSCYKTRATELRNREAYGPIFVKQFLYVGASIRGFKIHSLTKFSYITFGGKHFILRFREGNRGSEGLSDFSKVAEQTEPEFRLLSALPQPHAPYLIMLHAHSSNHSVFWGLYFHLHGYAQSALFLSPLLYFIPLGSLLGCPLSELKAKVRNSWPAQGSLGRKAATPSEHCWSHLSPGYARNTTQGRTQSWLACARLSSVSRLEHPPVSFHGDANNYEDISHWSSLGGGHSGLRISYVIS